MHSPTTGWLQKAGYRVLRVPVVDVDESLDDVIHGIYLEVTEPYPAKSLSPHPATPLRGVADLPA